MLSEPSDPNLYSETYKSFKSMVQELDYAQKSFGVYVTKEGFPLHSVTEPHYSAPTASEAKHFNLCGPSFCYNSYLL